MALGCRNDEFDLHSHCCSLDYDDFDEMKQNVELEDSLTATSIESTSLSSSDVEMCPGSNMTVSMFSDQFTGLVSECGFSDRAQKLTLNFLRNCLPRSHNMPSNNHVLSTQNQHFQLTSKIEVENGVIFALDMKKQFRHLLTRHAEKLAMSDC